MKRLLFLPFLTAFLCSSVFAEDLPILWLEAGKEREVQWVHPGPAQDWTLRFEHRTLASGRLLTLSGAATIGHRSMAIKTPPVNPGVCLSAKLYFGDQHAVNVVIASSDPFEDRKEWFDKHPIALYDPEKTTADIFEEQEIPFQHLRSFADIEAVKDAVIVVGQGVDFEREKGLAELLFLKATDGGSVLVASPKGDVPFHIPPEYQPLIYSLTLSADVKYLFPLSAGPIGGVRWALQTKDNQLVLAHNDAVGPQRAKVLGVGPSILDIRFANKIFGPEIVPSPLGRIMFDKNLVFLHDEFEPRVFVPEIETRYYFKTLIETLSSK